MDFAFVFPGQGSQSIGMMKNLEHFAPIRQTFEEASDILGVNFWQMIVAGPEELLNTTTYTQPIMLAAGVATWRTWLAVGGKQPNYVAGHSLGEYSALVAAGVLSFADALLLVQVRAQAMQAAVPIGEGAMAAVLGLEDKIVIDACDVAAQHAVLQAVNFNAPGQIVIAGQRDAVLRGIALCKEAGAKRVILLPVSVPAHCLLMKPAAEQLKIKIDSLDFNLPTIPILHNVDAAVHNTIPSIKAALVKQLYCPVRWVEIIQTLMARHITLIAEAGPGKVLVTLNKRINNQINSIALTDPIALDSLKQYTASCI